MPEFLSQLISEFRIDFQKWLLNELKQNYPEYSLSPDDLEAVFSYAIASARKCFAQMPPDLQEVEPLSGWVSWAAFQMLQAIKDYNPQLGMEGSRFVRTRIWQRLKNHQRELYRMNPPSLLKTLVDVYGILEERLERRPTIGELVEETGLDEATLRKTLKTRAGLHVYGSSKGGDAGEDAADPLDLIPSEAPSPEDECYASEKFRFFRECMEQLSSYEQKIVWIHKVEGVSLRDLSLRVDKSKNTVSPAISRAVKKLKNCIEAKSQISKEEWR